MSEDARHNERRPADALEKKLDGSEIEPDSPGSTRRSLTRRIRRYKTCLEWIRRSPDVPEDLAAGFASVLLGKALNVLFGSRKLRFTGGADSIGLFEEHFGPTGFFREEDASLYVRLDELCQETTPRTSRRAHDGPTKQDSILDEVDGFLTRLERYLGDLYSTEKEKARVAKIRKYALPLSAALILAAAAALYLAGRPKSSSVEISSITEPGGIVGHYYNGMRFERKVLERVDRQIQLSTHGSPAPGVGRDRFSVRWIGFIYIPQGGTSYLCIDIDDGARVYIDKRMVIDDWAVQPMHRSCRKVRLNKGWFPLKVDYFEETQKAVVRLLWGKTKKRVSVVPPRHLCCMK